MIPNMPKTSNIERNTALYHRARNSDGKAREELIERNMRLVISQVTQLLRLFPRFQYLRDDLSSAGFTGLVKGVNTLIEQPEVERPTRYLITAIQTALLDLLCAEDPGFKLRQKGKTPEEGQSCEVVSDGGIPAVEARDALESICETSSERKFLHLREAGFTLRECAEELQIPYPSLSRLSAKLEERFLRRLSV